MDLKNIAKDILLEKNNQHTWLNIKLPKINRIDIIDKDNNYFVKPNDCRWWYGDTKTKRYNNLCKKVPKGKRKEFQKILEHIHNMRFDFDLFVPEHPIHNLKFEKNPIKNGFYNLCNNGIIIKKNTILYENKEDCPICYEELSDKNYYVTACCGKKFCGTCIFKHYAKRAHSLNNTCPLCRQDFVKIPQVPTERIPYSMPPIISRTPSFDETPIRRQDTIYNRHNRRPSFDETPTPIQLYNNSQDTNNFNMAAIFNTLSSDPFHNIEDILNAVEPVSVTVGANDISTIAADNYFTGSITTAEPTIDYDASFSLYERLGTTPTRSNT